MIRQARRGTAKRKPRVKDVTAIVTEIVTATVTATATATEQETVTETGMAEGAEAVRGTDGAGGIAEAEVVAEIEIEIAGGEIGEEEGGPGTGTGIGIGTETETAAAGVEAEIATGVGTGVVSHAGPTLLVRKQRNPPSRTSRPWRRRARRLSSRWLC